MLGKRTPDFENILLVLDKKAPKRPTLFEFFLNGPLYERLAGNIELKGDKHDTFRYFIHAYKNAGYDYVTLPGGDFAFPGGEKQRKQSISLNDNAIITDRESFDKCPFMDPRDADYSMLADLESELPKGMKIIVYGPSGVLENVINLVGFDNLCLMMYDDPQLAEDVFAKVGESLVKYYEICGRYKSVGAMVSNDDWGFRTQTMLSLEQMRKYVFPWHKRIVETIHASGRPAILHSCGYYGEVIDDIIYDMKYDARHSYEDAIEPVETAYEKLNGKIAVLGGIDIDFMARKTPEQIKARSRAMLERSEKRGGYALGTGNSVPEYIPQENFLAMISAALEY